MDAPAHVRRRLSAVFASMSGAERVAGAVEMAEEAKEVTLAGIRARGPDLGDARSRLGDWGCRAETMSPVA